MPDPTPFTAEGRLPTGTVTFMFTDIEGSTRLLASVGEQYKALLLTHNEILRAAITSHDGTELSTEGDSFFAAFPTAAAAVRAAADAQRALAAPTWPGGERVRVRMGLHTGEGRLGGDNYFGLDVHRAARIAAAGHGGQVLVSDATRALVAADLPDGVALRDLAEHRLKDLPAPERLWQLDIEGLERDFPPLRGLDARPARLPVFATPLVGRERELDELARLLRERRLVTLTGPGGTGKTRLAVAAAERLAADFPDRAAFVALEGARDRTAVASAIAGVFGVREKPDRDLELGVLAFVREHRLLLVLDNFEQAMSAAPLVSDVLAASASSRVLITSRGALHLAGEQELRVPPLGLPNARGAPSPNELSRSEAVALFVERARDARPDFVLTNDNAGPIAEIVQRLDGLPLAIELAAAQLRLLSPQAVLDRLDRHLQLVGPGLRDRPSRQRTITATIDWSYELLRPGEQRLFERLAVFAGGWTLDAADEVCNPDSELALETLEGLAALAEVSLVHPDEDDEAEARFGMLQVIREFAAQRLAGEPDREAIARRHARYVLRLAETAEPQLVRSETRRWQRQLRREQENVRSTLRWSLDHGEAEVGLRTSGALWRYWHYWAELREGRRWLEALLALPAAAQPGVARAKGLSGLAGVVYWQGEPGRAQALYDEALAIYRALGEERAIAETLEALSMVAVARNDLDAVVARKWEAREHYLSAGDDVNASFIDATMPVFAFFTGSGGSIEDAIAATREGIDISRRHGRAYDLGDWLGSLAQVYQMAGDYPRAIEAFRETARVWYELGHVGMLPWLKLLAALELAEGRAARAVRLAAIAAKAVENIGGELPDAFTGVMGDPLEDARPQLAPEEYERAVAEGRAMSFDEAAAYVLEDAADTTPDADAHRANDGGHHAVAEW